MATLQHPDLEIGTSVGQYTIKRCIGSGGMGEVYEAMHTGLDKRVAVKTLRRQYAQNEIVVTRFLREGQLASRIRHPHIVDVTDVGVIDGLPCLVMEYLDGESLHALLKREGALELSRLVDLMLPVLAAVDAAHQQGIVHRDLKPANIFLARGNYGEIAPKVLDFGISKAVQDEAPSELTTDSTFLGSPHYVSPELARGERNLDGRSDQYSLGVILYEGSTGVRPFAHRAESFMALMFAIGQGDFQPPHVHRPDLPRELEQIVLRAMARERENRFQSVGALGRALLPFASQRGRLIWEPVFNAAPASLRPMPNRDELTVPVIPRAPFEETGGTLGRSVSEIGTVTTSRARPLGALWWGLAGAAALLVGVGAALGATKAVTLYKNRENTPVREGDVEAMSAAPQSYSVEVKVVPDDASIEIDGKTSATGSFAGTFPIDGPRHTLRISKEGYETQTVEFDHLAPPPATLELEKSETKHAKAAGKAGVKATPSASATGGGKPELPKDDPWSDP